MGIFDRARDVLGGNHADESAGQQYAEKVEGRAGQGDTGTPPEDLGGPEPQERVNPRSPGPSPADAIRSPTGETDP